MKLGGQHFHHYNLGIGMLATVAGVGLRGTERQRRHPAAAVAFGAANAMIVDELALLLDLKDVYWARDGRESVDVAVGLIATGATVVAGMPFWPHARPRAAVPLAIGRERNATAKSQPDFRRGVTPAVENKGETGASPASPCAHRLSDAAGSAAGGSAAAGSAAGGSAAAEPAAGGSAVAGSAVGGRECNSLGHHR